MKLIQQNSNLNSYLETSEIVDFGYAVSREVTELSYNITKYSLDEIDFIKNAYEFVRDKIIALQFDSSRVLLSTTVFG